MSFAPRIVEGLALFAVPIFSPAAWRSWMRPNRTGRCWCSSPRAGPTSRRCADRCDLTASAAGSHKIPALLPVSTRIFIAAIVFRLFTAFVAFLANVTFPPLQDQGFTMLGRAHPFWDTFARYDAGWYHGIASQGYVFGAGGRNNLAFFPVYPLLMRGGGTLLGSQQPDFYFAGIVVSWIAFASAMVMLYKLARLDLDERRSQRAVVYAAVFPFAYFFGVVYSESVFFLALVSAAYAFRTKRWAWGALAGAAMTATRVTGVMALPGLAWIAWQATRSISPKPREGGLYAALAVAACGAGIGLYCVHNYRVSGSLFAWYDAITHWNYTPGHNPFTTVFAVLGALITRPANYLAEPMAPYDTLNTLAAIGALALVPYVWKRFSFGYALIVLGGMLLPLSSGQLEGLGRYASVQFPIAIALASTAGEVRHLALLTAFAMLYAVCLSLFVTVHPLF